MNVTSKMCDGKPVQGGFPPENVATIMTILLFGLLFQCVGIYCCWKQKNVLKNQKIILLNLSVSEIFLIAYMIVQLCGRYLVLTQAQKDIANKTMCTLYHGLTVQFYCAMFVIPADRLASVTIPTVYHIHVTKATLKKVVLTTWILSIFSTLPFVASSMSVEKQLEIIVSYSYVAQSLFLLLSVVTYTIIGVKLLHSARLQSRRTSRCSGRIKRTTLISFVIISTFLLFYMAPNYIHTCNVDIITVKIAISYFGVSVDPIIYILLHNKLRPIAWRALTCNSTTRRKAAQHNERATSPFDVTSPRIQHLEVMTSPRVQRLELVQKVRSESALSWQKVDGVHLSASYTCVLSVKYNASDGAKCHDVTNVTNIVSQSTTLMKETTV